MKLKVNTILGLAMWLYFIYFIVAVILSVYLNVAWVNTFDFLFGFVLTGALSVWYVVDRIRHHNPSRPRTSRWRIGPYGTIYRSQSYVCPPPNPQK